MADILHPYGDLDVLSYYSKVAPRLAKFLKGREVAAKVNIPNFHPILNRGSVLPPLTSEELAKVDESFLKMRSGGAKLEDARPRLSPLQEKIWRYFPPRKLADLFYATNGEKGRKLDRIFFDIDRGEGVGAGDAQKAAAILIEEMESGGKPDSFPDFRFFTMYTGSSFHIYLMLEREVDASFYEKHLAYSKKDPLGSLTGRLAAKARARGVKVSGGHEKLKGCIILDPSQTPPGKLARSPFSLHMSGPKTVDGVAVPISPDELREKGLLERLRAYTPERVLDELDSLAKLLP